MITMIMNIKESKIKDLFKLSVDKDYYKPILVKSG